MSRRPPAGSIYRPKYHRKDGTIAESRIWWIKYYQPGNPVPFRESTKTKSWDDASRTLRRKLGEIASGTFTGPEAERVRMNDLFDQPTEDYVLNERKSLPEVKLRLKRHVKPAFGSLRVAELRTDHVRSYIKSRQRVGAANATVNRELAILRRALHLGSQFDPPLVLRVPYIPDLGEHNVRSGFLEHEVYLNLRDELPPYLRPLFVIAYHVGTRRGELTMVRWPQVEFAANRIVLNPGETKNEEPRTLPVYGEMMAWLQMAKSERDLKCPECPWVFQKDGRRIRTFYKAWNSACERAGVTGLQFHDLRRSAVRNMIRVGIPEKVAMAISGHKTRSMLDRYNIVSDRDLSDAAVKMEEYLGKLASPVKVAGKVSHAKLN